MRKLNLTEWAAVTEIIGTAAVVITLVIVSYSIKQNTTVMQASNDNFLYELQYARIINVINSPEMASIYVKRNRNEDLSEEEEERYFWDRLLELLTWEITFVRNRDGLFSPEQWEAWDNYYITGFLNKFPAEYWGKTRDWFGEDFKNHVDAAITKK